MGGVKPAGLRPAAAGALEKERLLRDSGVWACERGMCLTYCKSTQGGGVKTHLSSSLLLSLHSYWLQPAS